MSQRKIKEIITEEKSRIISKPESGFQNKGLAAEYGVSHSNIWKERKKFKYFLRTIY